MALTADKSRVTDQFKHRMFTLKSGNKAFKGARLAIELSTGKAVIGTTGTGLLALGVSDEDVDATSGDKLVSVDLEREIAIEYFKNDTGTAVVAANVGSLCYMLDDQIVTGASAGNSVAGRVWDVSATKGVGVQKLEAVPANIASLSGLKLDAGQTDPTFTSNDAAIASVVSGAQYLVPQNGAAATVTLPATATRGTVVVFGYDGTGGTAGNTITYRQGTTALTAALAGNKRHVAVAVAVTANIWAVTVTAQP